MNREWCTRIIQVMAITVTIAAVCQELEKPRNERHWHGKVAKFIPYDFRLPTIERFKESYWNSQSSQLFTPEVFGIGWAINFHALISKMQALRQHDTKEENFLMPAPWMRKVPRHSASLD